MTFFTFLHFVFWRLEFSVYIAIESDTKKEMKMKSIVKELERVQKRLDENLEELKKIYEAELAMRELCAYELQKCKK